MLGLVFLAILVDPFVVVNAHARLECPPSLSGETGEKVGPCDTSTDDLSVPAFALQANAFNTITWLESLGHPGAPQRFALSMDLLADGGDGGETVLPLSSDNETFVNSFESCLLLDHVPHDDYSNPVLADETTYHRSSITLWIPDIKCERCYLQLISVMSDEAHGVPVNTFCKYRPPGLESSSDVGEDEYISCMVVYHSCSPVKIDGNVNRNDIETCETEEYESILNWPLVETSDIMPMVEGRSIYEHSTYYYKGNPGVYDQETKQLQEIGSPLVGCKNFCYCDPAEFFFPIYSVADQPYTMMEGTCAAIIPTEVVPFQPNGELQFAPTAPSSLAPSSSLSVGPTLDPPIEPTTNKSTGGASASPVESTGGASASPVESTGGASASPVESTGSPSASPDEKDTDITSFGDDTESSGRSNNKWSFAYQLFMSASVTLLIAIVSRESII